VIKVYLDYLAFSPAVRLALLEDTGRTVDICGRCAGQTMVAMILPPKVGRVWSSSRASRSISSPVQSAVRPVLNVDATLGMKARPARWPRQ